ncbi:hypothetical protein BH09BAC3_BH09BAC3_35610 [soil metagenome]
MKTRYLPLVLSLVIGWTSCAAQPGERTAILIHDYLKGLEKDKSFSGGVLITKNNIVLLKEGFGYADRENKIPFSSSTLASMGSITKSFTAVGILKLAEQKKISLNDNLKKFFPDVPSDKEMISIHQLLTHSAGFPEFSKVDKGDYEKIGTEDFLKRVFSEPLAFAPGSKAIYTNTGFSILAIIIEKISGLEYEAFLKKELFKPIGIVHLGYQFPIEKGQVIAVGYQNGMKWGTHQSHFSQAGGGPFWNLKGNGGLEVSLDELEVWIAAMSNYEILNKASTELMFSPHITEDGTNGFYSFGYGCNISKSRRNTKVIDNGGSNGIYFARLVRFPEENVVVYMVTNEKAMNTNMVLPNVMQLYFNGKIEEQAQGKPIFQDPTSGKIYDLLISKGYQSFEKNMADARIDVQDDMVLLEVGQILSEQNRIDEAIALYEYYIRNFPSIVVAQNDLGDLYLMKNQKEKAIQCYKRALVIRPGNPRATAALKNLVP